MPSILEHDEVALRRETLRWIVLIFLNWQSSNVDSPQKK